MGSLYGLGALTVHITSAASRDGCGEEPLKNGEQQAQADKKSPAERTAQLLGHRIRIEALTILIERVASASEIAGETGDTVQLVSNHLRLLKQADAIEPVKTEKRGPVEEVYYRATRRPELTHEEWLVLSHKQKQELAVMSVRNLFAESLSAVETGNMVRDEEMYWWWKAVLLDQKGREEVKQEQDAHTARLLEIEAVSNARLVQAGQRAQPTPTVMAVLGFHRARPKPVNEIAQYTS